MKRSMRFIITLSAMLFMCLWVVPTSAQPLDPTTIPKYVTPLFIPPTMPLTSVLTGGIDYYEIAQRQFPQQVLPTGFPQTTVWGYGSVNHAWTFHYPSYTIEALVNRRVRVKWINDLVNPDGTFISHLFSADVDQTFHWANPPQQCADGTTRPDCEGTSGAAYTGPVPIVVHLHGSHVDPESDGHPEAWYLPAAINIPAGYAIQGSNFGQLAGMPLQAGAAVFQYRNDQRATTLWFHDHSLGITRLNIYAGPVGFYLLRGGPTDLLAGTLPGGIYEIGLVIQSRSFLGDGSLDFTSGNGQGNTMVVNGNTWPYLNVEPRRYRLRLLNADNESPIELGFATDNTPGDGIDDGDYTLLANAFWVIGADGGFLPAPANIQDVLPLHIAERADVIIDFSGFQPGEVIYLINNQGDQGTTDQVMSFVVVPLASSDTSTPPDQLALPAFTPLGPETFTRQVSVNDGVVAGKQLGTVDLSDPLNPVGIPLLWADAITENPQLNAIEIWEIFNFDGGDHPIHIHMVQFEILDRTPIGDVIGGATTVPPFPWETGTKDTVFVDGNTVTRVKALFDIPGRFVWHCHILEHEDDEMMRPYEVPGAPPPGTGILISPSGAITTNTPTYTWNAVLNSTWYYLWVNDSTGNRIARWYTATEVGCPTGTGTCSVTPTTVLSGGACQWWIQTWSDSSGAGSWNGPLAFTVPAPPPAPPAPTLVSPTGAITTTTPTYVWNALPTATDYFLWVNDSTGNRIQQTYSAAAAGCAAGTGTCSVTPTTVLNAGSGQWWVQAKNAGGSGPWSAPLSFTIGGGGISGPPGIATLVSPAGAAGSNNPTYTWNAVNGSTWYYLWVNDSTGNKIRQWYTAAEAGCGAGTGTCTVTPTTTAAYAGTGYVSLANGAGQWWVQTFNNFGLGPWSAAMPFAVP